MSRIRIFYNGNYYRLGSEPSSLDHLKHLVQSQLDVSDSIYVIGDSEKPEEIKNNSDYSDELNKSKDEILFYVGHPPVDLLEYEYLKKSLVLTPDSDLAEIIRTEMQRFKMNASIHEGFQCNECKINPIVGSRYFCDQCNFSLCEKCEESINYHKHDLLKYKKPQVKNLEKEAFGKKVFNAVKQIKDLGFKDDKMIYNALSKAGYDVQVAVEILFGET
ncbi:hypothetical protein SteCoe_21305 [Stentor coeruleus]|uniref:ZZ-type domain-containing protein n=1 Tax=Stentor coeruleus TaxID=5963 RepID=A0A1R2BQ36_9CILI|nr:hypothetical protein SteCoe_21305 [Stentor coeruleus]